MFCVECGKTGDTHKNGLCLSCYLKHTTFSNGPEMIDIIMCPNCGLFKYKNTWLKNTFNEMIQQTVKERFTISRELQKIQITPLYKEEKNIMDCTIEIKGVLQDQIIREQRPLKIRFKKETCTICSKQYGGYYEAILQIRADKRKLTNTENKDIKNLVTLTVNQLQSKGNRGLFITETIDEHSGIDFYLSEKGAAHSIAKKIQEIYGGDIKQSSTNIGMKDSKQVYRMTNLVRLPWYKKNDIFSKKDIFYFISSISKNKVHCIQLSTWAEYVFDGKDLQDAKIVDEIDKNVDMIVLSQTDTEIQLMHPTTYKIVEVKKPKKISFDSDTIEVIPINERLFLMPSLKKLRKEDKEVSS